MDSVNSNTKMMKTKLRGATEQRKFLEGKLQQSSKLWQGLDSKISSTRSTYDQLIETLQLLASQTEHVTAEEDKKFFEAMLGKNSKALDEFNCMLRYLSTKLECAEENIILAEEDKKFFEVMLGKNSKALDEFNCMLHYLSTKLECAEQKIILGKQEMLQTKQEKEEMGRSYMELYSNDTTIKEKDSLMKQFKGSVDENKTHLIYLDSRLQCLERELKLKDATMVARIQQDNEHKESTLRAYHKEVLHSIQSQAENELRERLSLLMKENELQIKSFRMQHEEECQRMQEELELQKSKEEKQRPLLQLQWKVMGESQQVNKKVNSKKVARIQQDNEHKESTHKFQSCPGNTAVITLDPYDLKETQRSYKIGIRKARAWCRANTKVFDLSPYYGPGAEIYTTPANGTFHLSFDYDGRRLTLFLYGRDLYVKGWEGDRFGMFEIEEGFIQNSDCRYLATGVNYKGLVTTLGKLRIGPYVFMEKFEVLHKCNGVITRDVAQSVAIFSVGTAEPIRLEDVFEEHLYGFDYRLGLNTLDGRRALSSQIRTYSSSSNLLLTCVDCSLNGDPTFAIQDPRSDEIITVKELRRKVRVPLRDSYKRGKFCQAEDDKKPAVWSPAYPDGIGWSDSALEEEDDVKYWPY